MRHWRSLGIHLVLYLDDGAGCEKDFASTQSCSDTVRSDLVKAGLVANCDKSIWIPTQCLDWLGISWDLLNATLTIPQPRVDRLLSALGVFKDKLPFVTPRFIASIVGKIISLSPCVGNVSLIMSRFLQSAVIFRHDWDTPLDLSRFQFFPQCLDEVNFWLDNCVKLNCKKLFEYSQPVVIICTDASDFACGGHAHFVDKEEFDLFYQAFSSMESTLDSNGREMLAILYALRSFKALVRGKVVKLYIGIHVYPGVSPSVSLDLLTTKFFYLWQTLEGSKKVFLRSLNHGRHNAGGATKMTKSCVCCKSATGCGLAAVVCPEFENTCVFCVFGSAVVCPDFWQRKQLKQLNNFYNFLITYLHFLSYNLLITYF